MCVCVCAIAWACPQLGCFEGLAQQESLARVQRLGALESLVKEQKGRETDLQDRYAELVRTRLTLQEELQKLPA